MIINFAQLLRNDIIAKYFRLLFNFLLKIVILIDYGNAFRCLVMVRNQVKLHITEAGIF
jgi:hypothetical protein